MTDTVVLRNADVHALEAQPVRADALAFRGGRVLVVGSEAEVVAAAGTGARSWDLGGAALLPGFVDAHHHPCIQALYGGRVSLVPPAVTDIGSLLRAISAASARLPAGEWLIAANWDEELLAERRAPTRRELDDAVPERPLLALHYSYHRAVANSRALEAAGIDRHTPDPSGGRISRGSGGVPDGLLVERAMSRVEALARASLVARDPEGFLARLAEHHRAMAAAGITRVVDATVPADLAALYREAARRGLLAVPTVMMPVSTTGWLEEPWDALDGTPTGAEDGPLAVGPLKLVFDGAPECAMCLGWWQTAGVAVQAIALSLRWGTLAPMRTALSVKPRFGRRIRTGVRIYKRAEADSIVRAAVERGFAVATHAIGNEAVDVALTAYGAAGAQLDRAGRPRIEHGTFLDRELIRRIADRGVAVSVQPYMLTLPAYANGTSIPRVGNFPLRWLLDAGVTVAGSSDFPVAGFAPLDGVRAAVTRRTTRGCVFEPDQRIALDEALAIYTRGAAAACGLLDRCGTLAPGKRADLVVLDGPLREAVHLDSARVRATIIDGKLVTGSLDPNSRV